MQSKDIDMDLFQLRKKFKQAGIEEAPDDTTDLCACEEKPQQAKLPLVMPKRAALAVRADLGRFLRPIITAPVFDLPQQGHVIPKPKQHKIGMREHRKATKTPFKYRNRGGKAERRAYRNRRKAAAIRARS